MDGIESSCKCQKLRKHADGWRSEMAGWWAASKGRWEGMWSMRIVLVSWSLDIKVFVLFTVHALITQVSDSVKL